VGSRSLLKFALKRHGGDGCLCYNSLSKGTVSARQSGQSKADRRWHRRSTLGGACGARGWGAMEAARSVPLVVERKIVGAALNTQHLLW
jgi:hypothetical protein